MEGVGPTGCAAPSAALYLRPDGWVSACCATWHVLGRVTGPERRSLRSIWEGAAAERQRAALAVGDHGYGCWECGHAVADGRRDQSTAAEFDDLVPAGAAGFPSAIDFALSNRCNLQCEMCNGGLSSTIRERRDRRPPLPPAYDDRFFAELDEFLPHLVRTSFKGGEPFLIPEHRRVWDRLLERDLRPSVVVATNGTVLSAEVERYVRELEMDVVVSVDGVDPVVLEGLRVGVRADRLWANIDRFGAIAHDIGRPLTLTFCLMAQNWGELGPVLEAAHQRAAQVHVVWVDGPRSFRLLGAATAELEAARRRFEEDLAVRTVGEPGRATLADALDRVGTELARRPAAGTAVALGPRRPADRLADARHELGAAGAVPAEVVYRDEVAVEVLAPEWAAWLDLPEWVGSGLEEAMTRLATRAGAPMRTEVASREGGSHRVDAEIERDGRVERLVAVYVPPAEGADESRLLFAPAPR